MNQTRRWIDVPGAPVVPRLRFCLYSGEEDIPAGQNENQALALHERHRCAADRSASEWHKPLEL